MRAPPVELAGGLSCRRSHHCWPGAAGPHCFILPPPQPCAASVPSRGGRSSGGAWCCHAAPLGGSPQGVGAASASTGTAAQQQQQQQQVQQQQLLRRQDLRDNGGDGGPGGGGGGGGVLGSPGVGGAGSGGTVLPEQDVLFRYPGDHTFNLNEYMVVLDKPIGLTLAPDPATGQIVVQDMREGSPAAQCGMIQVGDVVKKCSAVFGEDMWQAIDIRRIRWAINNRTSKIKLVLERARKPHAVPSWYGRGQVGRASQERDALQLPVSFNSVQPDEQWAQDLAAPGRPLMCTFHTSVLSANPAPPRTGAAAVARSVRLQLLREELAEARREPEMELGPPAAPSSASAPSSSSASSSASSSTTASPSGAAPSTSSSASSGLASSSGPSASSSAQGGGRQGAKDASSASSATASSGGRQGAGGGGPSNSVGPIIGRLIESLAGGKPGGNNSNSSSSTNNVPSSSAGGSGSGQGASAASGGASLGTASSGAGAAPLGSSSTGALLLQQQQQQAAARRGVSGVREKKKVTPVLPWLLVSSGRLDTRDLTQIASHRGLGAILELGLTRGPGGALMLRGSEATALGGLGASGSMAEVNVSSLLASAAAAGTGPGGGPGSNGLATVGPALQPPQQPAGAAARALVGLAGAPQGGPAAARVGAAAGPGGAQQQQAGGGGAPAAVDVRYRCLVHLAAALQRLVVRRTCGTMHHSPKEACNVLLHCSEPGMEPEVACLLAVWLHWYQHMPLQEALLSAEIALGCAIEQGVAEGATEALVAAAEERSNKVVLTWRYGGLSASVAGDLVGSWATRMPLMRCKNPFGCKGSVARGNFFLELTGLRPGVYYYKYIVDGTWAVDPAAPKVLDASGNWNNVLEVHQRPPVSSSRERLALARWHARHLAWENKMGLRP